MLLSLALHLWQRSGRRTDPPAEPAARRELAAVEDNHIRPVQRTGHMDAENTVKGLQHTPRSANGLPSQQGHTRFFQVVAYVCVPDTHRRVTPTARHESRDRRARDSVLLHCARSTHGNRPSTSRSHGGQRYRPSPVGHTLRRRLSPVSSYLGALIPETENMT